MSYADFANTICHKTQKAAQAMIQARITANSITLLTTAQVFAGIGGTQLTPVRVVAVCQNAVPQTPFEGNWDADLSIKVIAPFEEFRDNEDGYHELAGQIFAFFFQEPETVAARLSNATIKYTAQFVYPTGCGWEIENYGTPDAPAFNWVSEQKFRVTCCGSVIA